MTAGRRWFLGAVVAGAVCVPLGQILAQTLPAPRGAVILTVTGGINNTVDGDVAAFGREDLEALGMVKLTTTTPWYNDAVTFEGVPLKAVLERVGAKGTRIVVTALNSYAATVPMSDVQSYDPLLALKRDGEYLPVRDKGPLFLVYPFDQHPQLKNEVIYARSVWQIKEIEMQ